MVAQPDRGAGRGRRLRRPPVAEVAAEAGIAVVQPARLREAEALAAIAEFAPELQVVAAYGQLLPASLLDAPAHGTLNVHASLLPRWRGASPVSAAIAAGDAETGATIMLVDETEDTGPILAQRATPIGQDETAGELSERLAELGAALLIETIPRWLAGEIAPRAQDGSLATRARRVHKEAGRIDWGESAAQIARNARAYTPWPGAYTELEGQRVRVAAVTAEASAGAGVPGEIMSLDEQAIRVATGEGVAAIGRLQRAGKRELSAAEFARGAGDLLGKRFGAGDD